MAGRKLLARAIDNWPVKVLSIGLAIILFVFHRMSTMEERFFFVPLHIEQLTAMTPSSSYPRVVRVSLRGEGNSIFPIMEDDIQVYVDVGRFRAPGAYTIPIQWRKKGTAIGGEPLQITVDPIQITISLDNKVSKFVPLTASFRGQVETGHVMASYSLNPAQVMVEGPAELMWGVSDCFTEYIDIEGRRSDFSMTVNILNRDPLIVIRGSGTAEFTGLISQIIPVRNIANVPITVRGLAEGLRGELETGVCNLRLEGQSQNIVDRFAPPRDFLTVDCSEITEPGIYALRVITGAAGNMNFRADPGEVRIQINYVEDGQP